MRMRELECFGKLTNTGKCPHCKYMEACRFATQDTKRTAEQDLRWRNASEFDDTQAVPGNTELPVDITAKRTFSHDEVVALSAFLLRIGSNRKLGRILEAKLMGAKSFSAIAKREGVSRQAIHKRIGKELANVFGFKSRQLTDSRLLSLTPSEFALLKLTRAGYEDGDIQKELRIDSRKVFEEIRKHMEWKLSRAT